MKQLWALKYSETKSSAGLVQRLQGASLRAWWTPVPICRALVPTTLWGLQKGLCCLAFCHWDSGNNCQTEKVVTCDATLCYLYNAFLILTKRQNFCQAFYKKKIEWYFIISWGATNYIEIFNSLKFQCVYVCIKNLKFIFEKLFGILWQIGN